MKKAITISLFIFVSSLIWAQNRYALVIGNSNYPGIDNVLPNAINDSKDISAALINLDYQVVIKNDLRRLEMTREIEAFISRLRNNRNSEGFFWYAGHSYEIDDEVFLAPLDVNITSDETVKNSTYQIKNMLKDLEAINNKVNVIVLDACRVPPAIKEKNFNDNPASFTDIFSGSNNTPRTRQLKRVPDVDVPADMFIIYSTSPGNEALDGETGKRNSPFAEAFLANINSNEPLILMFYDIVTDTKKLTRNIQIPDMQYKFSSNVRYSLNSKVSPNPTPPNPRPAPIPDGLLYEIASDSIIITGYTGTSNSLNIPDKIQNLSVKTIGYEAFKDNKIIKKITIPSSVTLIDRGAFNRCDNLESINIPSSVLYISQLAFYACQNLTSINVDSRNTNYLSVDGVLFDKDKTMLIAFPAGKKISTYNIPVTVLSIGPYAFGGNYYLNTINIPHAVSEIGYGSFFSCNSLLRITLPNSVTFIDDYAFAYCYSLTSINIPPFVTFIGSYAFKDCRNLTNISVSRRATNAQLGVNAFPIPPPKFNLID
jgi:hypothetical protein